MKTALIILSMFICTLIIVWSLRKPTLTPVESYNQAMYEYHNLKQHREDLARRIK